VSFNVPYNDHFRITNLPDAATLRTVFARMSELLDDYRNRPRAPHDAKVVHARSRFKG
jgi:alanine-synthesizing transaminase